jgi:DtxR family Mn-dependent transcriptional regulator
MYRLSMEKDEVTTTDLARSLKVSPASVTGMLKRLAERGLIHYQPYHAITLTEEGRIVALKIIRRHGLLEKLLTDVIGLPWHLADQEAARLEHHITTEVEERIARLLGHPQTCPHGQPINWLERDSNVRLSTLQPSERARVARIGIEEPDFLLYIENLRLQPGAEIRVVDRGPFNGPLRVMVGDQEHYLGDEVAANVWVERLDVDAELPSAPAASAATG